VQDEASGASRQDEEWLLHLEVPEERETDERDRRRLDIHHRLPGEDDRRTSNGSSSRRSGPFDEGLNLWIDAMPDEPPSWEDHAEVDWQEDADCRHQRTGQPTNEIADEGSRDHDLTRRDQADGDRIEELARGEPVMLGDDPFSKERHDRESTAEDERSRLQEEEEQAQLGVRRCRA